MNKECPSSYQAQLELPDQFMFRPPPSTRTRDPLQPTACDPIGGLRTQGTRDPIGGRRTQETRLIGILFCMLVP